MTTTTDATRFVPASELPADLELPFFVYGTLKSPYSNHRVVQPFLADCRPAVLQGASLWTLQPDGGPFPFLVEEDEPLAEVQGELIAVDPARYRQAMERLDRLEGYSIGAPAEHSMYIRCRVQVRILNGGGAVDAWVYVAGPRYTAGIQSGGLYRVESGDWTQPARDW